MCDQTEVSYNDGDVVWVKINSIWWPGIVKDLEKDEEDKILLTGLKTKPIACVKFFGEDTYEFVKKLENIYHYNCRRKDEFIKKGLDKHRTGAKIMATFPSDITKAEELVNGDKNIVNDPKFAPTPKTNYNDIFGSGKKQTKKSEEKPMVTPRKKVSAGTPFRPVTTEALAQRRKHRGPLVEEGAFYNCPFCMFTSRLIDVIVTHVHCAHSSSRVDYAPAGYKPSNLVRSYTEPRSVAKSKHSSPVKRKTKPVKNNSPEVEKVCEEEPVEKPSVSKPPVPDASEKERKKRYTDALLADWSDDDEEIKAKADEVQCDELAVVNTISETETDKIEEKVDETQSPITKTAEPTQQLAEKKDNTVSCFDFDEEDEGFIGMSDANTYGRKIPRVIPVKDKTDLGMDLEIEELFKRKVNEEGEVNDEELCEKEREAKEEQVVAKPKRRGRRKKSEIEAERKILSESEIASKVVVSPAVLTMASMRERRPGARKSYLNEKIEQLDDCGAVIPKSDEDIPSKSSRRKQDLKRSSLVELDELNLIGNKRALTVAARVVQSKSDNSAVADDLASQVDSLLAETAKISIPSEPVAAHDKSPEVDLSTVEYLEEEPDHKVESELAEMEATPTKHWKEPDQLVKKSSIPHWQQEIREALNTNKEPPKDASKDNVIITENASGAKLVTLKGSTSVKPKSSTIYLVKPQSGGSRPKILRQTPGQQLMIVNSPRMTPNAVGSGIEGKPRLRVVSTNSPTSKPVVQVISDKSGVKKLAIASKKVIQIKPSSSPQKYVLSGNSNASEGLRVIENFNGTGKTVLIKETTGSSSTKQSGRTTGSPILGRKVQGVVKSGGSPQYIIKRVKQPDGKYTIQTISKAIKRTGVLPQTSRPLRQSEPLPVQETVGIVANPDGSVVAETPNEAPAAIEPAPTTVTKQIVAMPGPPGPDGRPTYVLLAVDENGVMHTVDNSMMLTYDTQAQGQLLSQETAVVPMDTSDELTPTVYSTTGQDILAEALANTNVLGDSDPIPTMIIPTDMEEDQPDTVSLTSHTSILTSLGVPPTIIADTPRLVLAPPIVQETSVTLQKPIMTPVEVPTAIVADTSDLQPPPLPPTPTDEDVLMEEAEGGLLIAETPATEEAVQEQVNGDFFIDDSQGEEATSFHSMPLLNEESTASEEPIGDQSFEPQSVTLEKTSEYLPTSTNADLEEQQDLEETVQQEEVKEGSDMPYINEEGFVVEDRANRSQETEVSSTTEDGKDNVS